MTLFTPQLFSPHNTRLSHGSNKIHARTRRPHTLICSSHSNRLATYTCDKSNTIIERKTIQTQLTLHKANINTAQIKKTTRLSTTSTFQQIPTKMGKTLLSRPKTHSNSGVYLVALHPQNPSKALKQTQTRPESSPKPIGSLSNGQASQKPPNTPSNHKP